MCIRDRYYDDPVYDVHDADDDGQIDNPGEILYFVPTRTGQTDNYNLSVGVSATWSKPLDKELQEPVSYTHLRAHET